MNLNAIYLTFIVIYLETPINSSLAPPKDKMKENLTLKELHNLNKKRRQTDSNTEIDESVYYVI